MSISLTAFAKSAKDEFARGNVSDLSEDLFKILQGSMYQEFLAHSNIDDVAKAMSLYTDMNNDERKLFLDLVSRGRR